MIIDVTVDGRHVIRDPEIQMEASIERGNCSVRCYFNGHQCGCHMGLSRAEVAQVADFMREVLERWA